MQQLGLPNITAIMDVFNFDMNSVTVESILALIGDEKLTAKITAILKQLQVSVLAYYYSPTCYDEHLKLFS